MADNTKLTARVPIVCADFEQKEMHKDHELVMDYVNQDIYLHESDRYINITGRLKDQIQEIQDGSMVVHIVTENSLPPIKDRPENHWYYVVTKAQDLQSGQEINTESYIYYGVVDQEFFNTKNYILIAQNMIAEPQSVHLSVNKGYKACFYVPTAYNPNFYDNNTGEVIPFDLVDRLYVVDNNMNSIVAVDVYLSQEEELGDIDIMVDYQGDMYYQITLEANESGIEGLVMPDSPISVKAGGPIGSIEDPQWTELRYIFKGWSLNKLVYDSVNLATYIPEKNMKLYAFFEYVSDESSLAYSVTNVSSTTSESSTYSLRSMPTQTVLSRSTGVEKPNVLIYPKSILGYNSPDPMELVEEGQEIIFVYTPIEYEIKYEAIDGATLTDRKDAYTIEEEYIPSIPYKENHTFLGWNPEKIEKGATGTVTFIAKWREKGITLPGPQLNKIFDSLDNTDLVSSILSGIQSTRSNGILDNITAINRVSSVPDSDLISPVNISCNSTEILAWWVEETHAIHIYCEDDIICNSDMTGAFANMTLLRSITGLRTWIVNKGTNLSNVFNGDNVLSNIDPVYEWNPGEDGDFTDMFKGTAAQASGNTPSWYSWNATILYYSSTGKLLDKEITSYIPNEEVLAKNIIGYKYPEESSIIIDENNGTYQFEYVPNDYSITYELNGGSIGEAKKNYTIEDADYYPPTPIKDGSSKQFNGWSPEYIPSGSTGDVTFIATWK